MLDSRPRGPISQKKTSRKRKPFQSLKNVIKSARMKTLRPRKTISKGQALTPKSIRKTAKKKEIPKDDDYETDILNYLREKEKRQQLADDVPEKTAVSAENRRRLVDWMILVGQHMEQETLELAVAVVDRSLGVVQNVRDELQTVGVAAIFLARKYEEVDFAPEDIMDLCTHIGRAEILAMEARILCRLRFSLGFVLPSHFLKHLQLSPAVSELAVFLSNVAIYSALPMSSSHKASTALYLSSLLLDTPVEQKESPENVLLLTKAVLAVHRSERNLAVRKAYQKSGGMTDAMVGQLEKIAGDPKEHI